jgi:hypothetical protein
MSKPKIRVHNPTNSVTRYSRNYNYFFDVFTNYLKKFFNVEENRFFEHAHAERFKVDLLKGKTDDLLVMECEYVIENLTNGEFVVMTVADYPCTSAWLPEHRAGNEHLKKVIIAQYNPKIIHYHVKKDLHKFSPWSYFQSGFFNLDVYHEKRKYIKNKIDRLYYKGETPNRPFLNHIDKDLITDFSCIPGDMYMNELINHKIALSIDGVGEFCYRDVELMGLGVPMIRYEYISQMKSPLIPNHHYISLERPDDLEYYRLGEKPHADALINRYNEVVNNEEFLEYISSNARQYYIDNFEYKNLIIKTFELLELTDWLHD